MPAELRNTIFIGLLCLFIISLCTSSIYLLLNDLEKPEWFFEKNIYTIEPHVVELITEYNDDYKRNDTPSNEARWEWKPSKGSWITLCEIDSLSCLFYIDLKSFFRGGNYHKKAMNSLSLMLSKFQVEFIFIWAENRFSTKTTKFCLKLSVDKFNDHSIH